MHCLNTNTICKMMHLHFTISIASIVLCRLLLQSSCPGSYPAQLGALHSSEPCTGSYPAQLVQVQPAQLGALHSSFRSNLHSSEPSSNLDVDR